MRQPEKLNASQKKLLAQLEIGTENEMVKNPYSGVEVELEPTAVALYDYIKGCEITGNYKFFDMARYLFADQWPDEYMKLLD